LVFPQGCEVLFWGIIKWWFWRRNFLTRFRISIKWWWNFSFPQFGGGAHSRGLFFFGNFLPEKFLCWGIVTPYFVYNQGWVQKSQSFEGETPTKGEGWEKHLGGSKTTGGGVLTTRWGKKKMCGRRRKLSKLWERREINSPSTYREGA